MKIRFPMPPSFIIMVIWFTGLSGSGKSTLSNYLKEVLEKADFSVCQVDGDIFRQRAKKHDKFSRADITKNNRQIISHCQKIEQDYDFIIVSVISPYQQTRDEARKTFGKGYVEIFLDCPLPVLVKNDVKGLYERARKGEIKNMIGFSPASPYERPKHPNVTIRTDVTAVGSSIKEIINVLQKNHGVKL